MRAGGGKAKGSAYERDICKALSLWVSAGEREDLFWRSAMSGGRATVGKRKGKDLAAHAGDISATHEDGHVLTNSWYIECKRYADLQYASFMLKGEGNLARFWNEACAQATAHGKMPMLIAREDRGATTVIVAHTIQQRTALAMPHAVYTLPDDCRIASLSRSNCSIYDFDRVLAKPFVRVALPPGARWLKPGEDPFTFTKVTTPRVQRIKRPRVESARVRAARYGK